MATHVDHDTKAALVSVEFLDRPSSVDHLTASADVLPAERRPRRSVDVEGLTVACPAEPGTMEERCLERWHEAGH